MTQLLLCTDLDRTLIPNGDEPESEQARARFHDLIAHPDVTLVYVTGRHQELVQEAVKQYQLPEADFVIADVGSMIYQITNSVWEHLKDWELMINHDWHGKVSTDIQKLIQNIQGLQLQEKSKQNTHKLSYYLALDIDYKQIISTINQELLEQSIQANIIWSVDQQMNIGLLDILPASAGKRQAIEFLMRQLHFSISNTVFAGDSGNDICVLSSPIQSVLVANATAGVRDTAITQARENHQENSIYLAQGNFLGMNGNYSAGILEGVVHYIPQALTWIRDKE